MKSSRRSFLQSAVAAPLAATLGRPGTQVLAALVPPAGQEQFENPKIIRYDSRCFTLNDRDTFIHSAAFHYPRCPRALWRDRLFKFQQAGFNTIETYVFWNYHEPEEGKINLNEFEDFIKLVQEMGFFLIARPGPYVCAEWERGGFPAWVAARRFPLRTNHPESLKTSQHWFSQVLPVIQRHQITVGGPIIMVQIENEYDFSPPLPDAEKREYLRALAQMAWSNGIDVPLITCWTKQARQNSDPDMARLMDTCNFYPRWEVTNQVFPALDWLRKQEPNCPLGITELQGGWFSQFGGQLSVDQEGVSGAQLNLLTKTVIEQGVTYYSYYMGFGGSNFDWAAKSLTTTYDYAAPIREPGGLWEKYYAARGICLFLKIFPNLLTRAAKVPGVVQTTNANVTLSERASGKSAALFVRENANAPQRFKMTFVDVNSPTRRLITVPREGELEIGPREMKMLAVQVPLAGGHLRYCTAEVLAQGLNLDRPYVIVYDEPGRLVEIGLPTPDEPQPQVQGDAVYQYWDSEYESVVFGVRVEKQEKVLVINNSLLVVVVPRDRALRTWSREFPTQVVPGSEEPKPMSVPFITDAYLLASSDARKNYISAEIDFLPGEHEVTALLPPLPTKCRLDGSPATFEYDRPTRTVRVHVSTPPLPVRSFPFDAVRTWVEKFDPQVGEWVAASGKALEDLGPVPYGYVKYRGQFAYQGEPRMFMTTLADDFKQVFINGVRVAEGSNNKRETDFDLSRYARPGSNLLEIAYEAFGAYNGGKELNDLKGFASVRYGKDTQSGAGIESWQVQRFPVLMRGREVNPELAAGAWTPASLQDADPHKELQPAFTWCRAEFALDATPRSWTIPWKLTFEADRDALMYLNGKFVGRYVTIGPQREFYLPEPYLFFGGQKNVLVFVLAYAGHPGHVRTLRVGPYEEFSVCRTRLEFEW